MHNALFTMNSLCNKWKANERLSTTPNTGQSTTPKCEYCEYYGYEKRIMDMKREWMKFIQG